MGVRIVAVVLGVLVALALSGYLTLTGVTLQPGRVIYERVGIFSDSDAPFGSAAPFVGFAYNFTALNPAKLNSITHPLGELVILHHSLLHRIGIGHHLLEKKLYCCTKQLFDEKLCDRQDALILHFDTSNAVPYPPERHVNATRIPISMPADTKRALVQNEAHKYYFALQPKDYVRGDGTARMGFQWPVQLTGVYYLFIANCDVDDAAAITLEVTGLSEWKNPYGHLNGEDWGYMPGYWTLMVLSLALLVWFAYRTIAFRFNLARLQILLFALLGVLFIEQLLWAATHTLYNKIGLYSDLLSALGAFASALKDTGLRVVVLLLAYGYSLSRETLTRRATAMLAALALSYLCCAGASEFILYLDAAGTPADDTSKLVVDVCLGVANLLFVVWIGVRLIRIMPKLADLGELEQRAKYIRLAVVLAFAVLVSVSFFVTETVLEFDRRVDDSFQYWWLWEMYSEVIHLVIVGVVAIAWGPSAERVQLFNYSNTLQDDLELNGDLQTLKRTQAPRLAVDLSDSDDLVIDPDSNDSLDAQ